MTDLTPTATVLGWQGPIAALDVWAGELDRRMFHEMEWPDLPRSMGSSHYSDVSVGTVDEIQILTADDGTRYVWGRGRFSSTPEGASAATQVAEGTLRTVSVEIRDGSFTEWPLMDENEEVVGWAMEWDRAVIGAFALERNPAFAGAVIVPDAEAAAFVYVPPESPNPGDGSFADDGERPDTTETEYPEDVFGSHDPELSAHLSEMRAVATRQAAVGPDPYPARFFSRLDYSQPTRLTISPEGEVTGHVAVWGRRYRQQGGGDWVAARCGDLSEWLVGAAPLDDGRIVNAGVIVSDALHQWGPQDAAAMRRQVEDTSRQVMQVTAWEDQHGLAVHGSTLPGVSPQDAARAMAGCPSIVTMDQKDGRGHLPVAVLCVNTCGLKPGDAVVTVEGGAHKTRVLAASAAGEPTAAEHDCGCAGTCGACQLDDALAHSVPIVAPRQASAEPDPPKVVDLRSLEQIDADWQRSRLKAATSPKPTPKADG